MKGNPRGSGYAYAEYSWYCEPRRAIDALLDVEKFDGSVWDPACGGGNIPRACRDRGIEAIGTDIVQRGGADAVADFLRDTPLSMDHIITNPPFELAVEFTLHALSLARHKVAIVQRTSWLEGRKRHRQLFSGGRLARMWQFSSRISMPPGGVNVAAKNGSVSYAWFVFSNDHQGPPTLGWLP
jgi:hypothetical protein